MGLISAPLLKSYPSAGGGHGCSRIGTNPRFRTSIVGAKLICSARLPVMLKSLSMSGSKEAAAEVIANAGTCMSLLQPGVGYLASVASVCLVVVIESARMMSWSGQRSMKAWEVLRE